MNMHYEEQYESEAVNARGDSEDTATPVLTNYRECRYAAAELVKELLREDLGRSPMYALGYLESMIGGLAIENPEILKKINAARDWEIKGRIEND